MKKLHILIPSLAIASTLPALTAISCGKGWTSQWNLNDGEFVWKHDQPSLEFNTEGDLTNGYFERINKKILADDIVCHESNFIWHGRDDYKSASVKIRVDKIDKTNHLLSFDLYEILQSKTNTNENTGGDIFASYKNIPFVLHGMDYLSIWTLAPNYASKGIDDWILSDWYKTNKQWSFTVKMTAGDRKLNGTINYKSLGDVTKCQAIINQMCAAHFISTFFENVTIKEEKLWRN